MWAHDPVRPKIVKTLKEIHKLASYAKIVLMGYPRLFENNGACVAGIGTAEGPWLNEMADGLAKEMKGAAGDAGPYAVFADPRTAFAGQAICGGRPPSGPRATRWRDSHRHHEAPDTSLLAGWPCAQPPATP